MEPRNQKILMRFSALVFAWVLFPYSRTTSRTLATRVGGRTKSYKYYRNRKENFLLLETSKVKIFVLISDYILGRQLITPLKNEFSPQCVKVSRESVRSFDTSDFFSFFVFVCRRV